MSSTHWIIGDILDLLVLNEPKTIVDIGTGFGKWGFLSRLYLELEPHKKENWEIQIDGIEIFSSYLTLLREFYSSIQIADMQDCKIANYDIALCIGVIEHIPKKEGLNFLTKLIQNNKSVIVTSPKGFKKQGALWGNIHETHVTGWSQKDFKKLGLKTKVIKKRIIAFSSNLRTTKPLRKFLPLSIRRFLLKQFNPPKHARLNPKIQGET